MTFIYHLFPLGVLNAPHENNLSDAETADGSDSSSPLLRLVDWIPYLQDLGADGVLFGPVFQSETHGYDVVDPYRVDSRLGTEVDLAAVCDAYRDAGLSIMFDAVFNHVGRSFFAFQDLIVHGEASRYRDWFHNIDFSASGRNGDPFRYDTWDGHDSLVKLNLEHPEVVSYLLDAVKWWRERFGFSGLRLDAADVITPSFWPKLRDVVGADTFLIGEMVHGDYSTITAPDMLDGATNYECYKGLYSSFNDGNLFEIAWSLNRQFGPEGIYRDLPLQTFVDNHDVNRIADTVDDERYLYPIHLLVFTIPGIPSVYYGSEAGISGRKGMNDWPLRPALTPGDLVGASATHPDLRRAIQTLAALRRESMALQSGTYRQLHVSNGQLVFLREVGGERVIVAVNGTDQSVALPTDEISDVLHPGVTAYDMLNGCEVSLASNCLDIPAYWGRIIRVNT